MPRALASGRRVRDHVARCVWTLHFIVGVPVSASVLSDSSYDDAATVVAVGVLAATLAVICHETLGHGLACVGIGGHVKLLTYIWFRCSKYAPITDAGGPIGNLVGGSLAILLLAFIRPRPAATLFLFVFAALNLFWFTAQLTFESLTHAHDDWYWLLQSAPAIWRPVGALVGIGGYVLTARCLSAVLRTQAGPRAHAIRLAYAAAAASAVITGLMWGPEPWRSAVEGFSTFGINSLALLMVARRADRAVGQDVVAQSVPRSWPWICFCVVCFAIFLFVQARGMGPMAASRLSP